MALPKIEIHLKSGSGSTVSVDGLELTHVRRIALDWDYREALDGNAPIVTVDLLAQNVTLFGDGARVDLNIETVAALLAGRYRPAPTPVSSSGKTRK